MDRKTREAGALERFAGAIERLRQLAVNAAEAEADGRRDERNRLELEAERICGELHRSLDGIYRELAPLDPRERHQTLAVVVDDDIETAWWLSRMGLN